CSRAPTRELNEAPRVHRANSVRIDRLDPRPGRPEGGTGGCADEVSLKGANNPTRGRKLRSTGTKASTRAARSRESQARPQHNFEAYAYELEKKLEARERELSEALEQQAATIVHSPPPPRRSEPKCPQLPDCRAAGARRAWRNRSPHVARAAAPWEIRARQPAFPCLLPRQTPRTSLH